jgi:hypothetical protein
VDTTSYELNEIPNSIFLGITEKDQYYFYKCLPMGAAVSCALFESFSTALHWFVQNQSGCEDILRYLDDFLFGGSAGSTQCKDILKLFQNSCKLWSVPLAVNKTVEPTEVLIFLGIEFDTINMNPSNQSPQGIASISEKQTLYRILREAIFFPACISSELHH